MSTVWVGDQINIEANLQGDHFNNDLVGDVNNDGNDQDTTGTARGTGGAAGGTGPTNFSLRAEQNKISELFVSKSKDTISEADFIRRLEDLAKTNQWTG